MRMQTYRSEAADYVPVLAGFDGMHDHGQEEQGYFTPAAARRPTPRGLLARIDWTAVGAGAFVYAVAFAAWVWLVR